MSKNFVSIIPEGLSTSMRVGRDFVRYKLTEPNRLGKRKKVPYHPTENHPASVTNPSSWGTFETCIANVGKHGTDGIGIVLHDRTLICIDLDRVRDPKAGVIDDEAMSIIERFKTCTEVSPSGTGVHIFLRGRLPFDGRNDGNGHEIYAKGRFIAMTGVAVPGFDGEPQERQEALDWFVKQYFETDTTAKTASGIELPHDREHDGPRSAIPLEERLAQARRFLDSRDSAVEGQGGDLSTFKTIASLIRGFDLNCSEGMELVAAFNRTKCIPPWTEAEIQRKVEIVRRKGRLPWGSLLHPRFPLTDSGNAGRMVSVTRDEIKFCREMDRFLVYDNGRYVLDHVDVLALSRHVSQDLRQEATGIVDEKLRNLVRGHAVKSESLASRKATIYLLRAEPGIAISSGDLDRDDWLLNVANGTINLRTGSLREFDRRDLITKQSPVSWDPAAECPRFLQFLGEIFTGNSALIDFIQRVVGYLLTGLVTEQCLFFLFGTGRNGKTTFIEVLLWLFGDFGIQTAPELLSLRKGEFHPTEQADLFGVRLAAAQEVKEGGLWDERAVKALTGGDRVRARKMRQDFFEFRPTHKFLIAANHKPIVRNVDLGIWRRIMLIPFNKVIAEADVDRHLPEKLRGELPGILRWAVQGCLQWQKVGLAPPPEVLEATTNYKNEMDIVGRFLDDECERSPSFREDSARLCDAFSNWCSRSGEEPLSARTFGERLIERGHDVKKSGGVKYRRGVRLTPSIPEVRDSSGEGVVGPLPEGSGGQPVSATKSS